MFRNILVAYDGSTSSREGLSQAADLARAQGSRLTVLTVNHIPLVPGYEESDLTSVYEEANRYARRLLDDAISSLPSGVEAEPVTSWGNPASVIVERAVAGEHDLVVLGSRRRGVLRAALLGSIAHGVLHHCHVPVLIVG